MFTERLGLRVGVAKMAAVMARNASFDPTKKGSRGDQLKALYLFSNPSIQSAKNFWRSLKDPKVFKPVLASTLGTGCITRNIQLHDRSRLEEQGKGRGR